MVKTSYVGPGIYFPRIFSKHFDTDFGLMMHDAGDLTFYIEGTEHDSNTAINDDQWHHVVATYDDSSTGSEVKMYVDGGAPVYMGSFSGGLTPSPAFGPTIGGEGNGPGSFPTNSSFRGIIDEVAVYDHALSQQQIQFHYDVADVPEPPPPPPRPPPLPIPDKVVVLTFDDANKSDIDFVAPLLQNYSFGATFAVSTAWMGNPNYMTWANIQSLHNQGFEIANHTVSHLDLTQLSNAQVEAEIAGMETLIEANGIPTPQSFVYPGWHNSPDVVEVVEELGYVLARRGVAPEFAETCCGGRGPAYDPALHDPLLIPTTGWSGPDWDWDDFLWALDQAKDGKVTVLNFHGVPDIHSFVSTEPSVFESYMQHLYDNNYTVIAMRDLLPYLTFAADFDEDHDVDSQDLLILAANFGTANGAIKMTGDTDEDGDVDGQDFLTWQRQFGSALGGATPTSASSTVPEPGTFSVVVFAIVVGGVFDGRGRLGGRNKRRCCTVWALNMGG